MEKPNCQLVPAPPMPAPVAPAVIDDDFIRSRIYTVRGVQVMLDRDLAQIYGVSTSRLNEQVKRNAGRFPSNFILRLSRTELDGLKSQNATSSSELRPIFKAMDGGDFPPQKIFYDGQLWDARAFVDRLVKRAKRSLVLIGASLKDLGRKCFGFTRMDASEIPGLKARM